MPQLALPGEAEAPRRVEEGLYNPAQFLDQSFGDGLCMIVGRGEFECKGLSTRSTAPKKPPMLGISYSKNNSLLKLTRPPFTLKYKRSFWGMTHQSENHLHPSLICTSKYRQDIKGRANGVTHLCTNMYVCAPHTCGSSSPEEDLLIRKSRP